MSPLVLAQDQFASRLSLLIQRAHALGLTVQLGEVFRPPEMCAIYAARGSGIKDSLHGMRLAADVLIRVHGALQEDSEAYRPLGEFWESQGPKFRWGGRFPRPDGNHFELLP